MGEFAPFQDKGAIKTRASDRNLRATIAPANVYLGVTVYREILGSPDQIQYLIDEEDGRVGIRALDEGETTDHSYAAREGEIAAASVWRKIGLSVDDSYRVPVDSESEDFLVLDVSEHVENGGEPQSGDHSEPGPEGEPGPTDEPTPGPDDEQHVHRDYSFTIPELVDRAAEEAEEERDGAEEMETAKADDGQMEYVGELRDLTTADSIGSQTITNLQEAGFNSIPEIRNATIPDLTDIPDIGGVTASRIMDRTVDIMEDEVEESSAPDKESEEEEERILDAERVSTAMDSVDLRDELTPERLIEAVDSSGSIYDLSGALDITRLDAEDVVRRLRLENALNSEDGELAKKWFEKSEAVYGE